MRLTLSGFAELESEGTSVMAKSRILVCVAGAARSRLAGIKQSSTTLTLVPFLLFLFQAPFPSKLRFFAYKQRQVFVRRVRSPSLQMRNSE